MNVPHTVAIDDDTFETWRTKARRLLLDEVPPEALAWSGSSGQQMLWGGSAQRQGAAKGAVRVPRPFVELAETVACHRAEDRWCVLYRVLWRLTHGRERRLLDDAGDDDVALLRRWHRAVCRDLHRMKAFVRFKQVASEDPDHEPRYVAWHRPEHRIVRRVAPFFVDRFRPMHWTILTPELSLSWDTEALRIGPGAPMEDAPHHDDLDGLWRTYYGAIFNPARLNLKAMRTEMPRKVWPTLPETRDVARLIEQAPVRVKAMVDAAQEVAVARIPEGADRRTLARAASQCTACTLGRCGRRALFGHGPQGASVMLVGDQPGELDNCKGRAFVPEGPDGDLLAEALSAAGLKREKVYMTYAVKHFEPKPPGARRTRLQVDDPEVRICRPWLVAELEWVNPQVIVALGPMAAFSLLGRKVALNRERGHVWRSPWGPVITTWHPAETLRRAYLQGHRAAAAQMAADIALAAEMAQTHNAGV
ncbi:MAG: TIGR03915 family putative DNA repair protein [Myxococcota bacterium]